jgi:FAD synthetase
MGNKNKQLRVLAFGTFDLLHPGHEYYLAKASKYGELYVIVARDATVEKVKQKEAINSEKERLASLKRLPYVKSAMLGSRNADDRYALIEKIKPDIICLGYDQRSFTLNLKENLAKRGVKPRIIRFRKSHKPNEYKSSILRHNVSNFK